MAIPTQFSVAKTRKCPLANPTQPVDGANPLTAEGIGFISGASVLPAKSAGDIGAPNELSALSVATIDNPVSISAQPVEDIDNASLFSALSASTINNPSVISAESVASVDNASVIGAESESAISAPTPFTAKAGTLVAPPFPLNHARILYRNKLENYQSVVSDVASNALNALKRNTWEKWTPSGPGYFKATMQFDIGVDAIALGAHNLGTKGYTVEAFYRETAAGPLIPFGTSITPTDDTPIMWHLPFDTLMRVVEIYISGSTGSAEVGYISAGKALQMQRPFFNGHNPFDDSDVTEYYAKRTESGERIGRDIRRKGFETSFEWQNLDDGWYRNYIPEFKQYAKINPIFVAWNLLEYPNDIAFGETTDDMKASMQNGTRTKRSGFGFTLAGV